MSWGVEDGAEHPFYFSGPGILAVFLPQDYPAPTPSPDTGNPTGRTKGDAAVDDPLVDEYNYETINEEYFTPLPYEDVNYNEEVDPQGGLTENAVEAELPTSTVVTYNETDVSLMNALSLRFGFLLLLIFHSPKQRRCDNPYGKSIGGLGSCWKRTFHKRYSYLRYSRVWNTGI